MFIMRICYYFFSIKPFNFSLKTTKHSVFSSIFTPLMQIFINENIINTVHGTKPVALLFWQVFLVNRGIGHTIFVYYQKQTQVSIHRKVSVLSTNQVLSKKIKKDWKFVARLLDTFLPRLKRTKQRELQMKN